MDVEVQSSDEGKVELGDFVFSPEIGHLEVGEMMERSSSWLFFEYSIELSSGGCFGVVDCSSGEVNVVFWLGCPSWLNA